MGDATGRTAVVIEDDDSVRDLLVDIFESAGFTAIGAASGAEGIDAVVTHSPLITTIDINMPGIDGIETTRRVRDRSDTHIMVVSALTDEADAVFALTAGADDFVPKPFRVREFRARIDAVLRRAAAVPPASHTHLDLTVDPETRVATRAGVDLGLTRTEFNLLSALIESGRRVRSKEELVKLLSGTDVDARTIEAHIAKLRRKLDEDPTEPRYIETVRGAGYRLTRT